MIDFFKIFLWKVFYFDHDFSTFWETTSLRDFSFSFRQKTFFSWKNFLFWRKKRGKNSNFLSIFWVKIQFIIWKESLNFWKKWVFNLLVVREVTVFFDIMKNSILKRALDWFKIMKSKYSIKSLRLKLTSIYFCNVAFGSRRKLSTNIIIWCLAPAILTVPLLWMTDN